MMALAIRSAVAALALAWCMSAQPGAKAPAFTAASIKRNPSTGPGPLGMQLLPGGRLRIQNLPFYMIVATDRPLIDRTGLTGIYQFETRGWSDMAPGPAPAPGALAEDGQDAASIPTVFTIFTSLGLKLDAQRAPVEMFVIESVEKPSEN
jgi:uncharacterized protein (TIGR03435 family)